MQSNEQHKIDELFRSKLSDFEVMPSPAVWDRISDSMGNSKRKRRALFIWSMSGAASLLMAFLLGWYLAGDKSNSEVLMAEMQQIRQDISNKVILESTVEQKVEIHFESPRVNPINESFFATHLSREAVKNEQRNNVEELKLLASSEPNRISNRVQFPEIVNINETFFSDVDKAIIEANLLAMNESKPDKNAENSGWAVGIQASPVYLFDQISVGQKDYMYANDAIQNQSTTYYNSNVTGGVSVAYNTGRLSFISGVNYNEVSQTSGDVALSYAGHNWLNDRNSIEYGSDSETEGLAPLGNASSSNNLVVNTQIGLANINLPAGASVASAKSITSLANEVAQNYDFKQNARYIEIPMLMRYKLVEKRLGLHVLGGINTNVLVDNSVRLESQNEILANGKVEGLRPLTLSSSLGMGVNYEITNHLNLSLEPTLKVQLNSLNSQQYVNAKPYAFGVFSGVSYRF